MLTSSKIRRRVYLFDQDDVAEAASMAESHFQEWLADGLAPKDTTRELLGHGARVVRLHVYRSPSNTPREVWVEEEPHRI